MKLNAENIDEGKAPLKKKNHLRLINSKKDPSVPSFYEIINFDQLAVVGSAYLADFQKGLKSFGISSTNYKASQQRTILALASYFDHLMDVKILIISDSLEKGAFKELVNAGKIQKIASHCPSSKAEVVKFYHHFDFLDLKAIMNEEFDAVVEHLFGQYDLILWDTPILSTQKDVQKSFSKIAAYFESFSVIVSPSASKVNNSKELRKHFQGHGINVSGVLFRELARSLD